MFRREGQALAELAGLWRDPVFAGIGVPRGDGRLVLVLPGVFGNDVYLEPLLGWLGRLGYRPVRSTLTFNAGCANRLLTQIEGALRRRMAWHPNPDAVALIGHSRGGVFAWALASRLQQVASHLAVVGSPVGAVVDLLRRGATAELAAMSGTSIVAEAGRQATRLLDPDCRYPDCGCAYVNDLRRPLSSTTRVLSLYSRDDLVAHPSSCVVAGAHNVEVGGSHSGLVYNRAVYAELASFLATPASRE